MIGAIGEICSTHILKHNRSATKYLARKSFEMHADLAQSLGVDCGYRKMETYSITVNEKKTSSTPEKFVEWIDGKTILEKSPIGTTKTTAQVHPKLVMFIPYLNDFPAYRSIC